MAVAKIVLGDKIPIPVTKNMIGDDKIVPVDVEIDMIVDESVELIQEYVIVDAYADECNKDLEKLYSTKLFIFYSIGQGISIDRTSQCHRYLFIGITNTKSGNSNKKKHSRQESSIIVEFDVNGAFTTESDDVNSFDNVFSLLLRSISPDFITVSSEFTTTEQSGTYFFTKRFLRLGECTARRSSQKKKELEVRSNHKKEVDPRSSQKKKELEVRSNHKKEVDPNINEQIGMLKEEIQLEVRNNHKKEVDPNIDEQIGMLKEEIHRKDNQIIIFDAYAETVKKILDDHYYIEEQVILSISKLEKVFQKSGITFSIVSVLREDYNIILKLKQLDTVWDLNDGLKLFFEESDSQDITAEDQKQFDGSVRVDEASEKNFSFEESNKPTSKTGNILNPTRENGFIDKEGDDDILNNVIYSLKEIDMKNEESSIEGTTNFCLSNGELSDTFIKEGIAAANILHEEDLIEGTANFCLSNGELSDVVCSYLQL